MPSDVVIRFRVDGNELSVIDAAGSKLADFGKSASNAKSGGVTEFVKGMTDLKSAFDIFGNQALGMIDQVNQMGVASLRARAGLDAMSSGQSVQYVRDMTAATKGLVDNMSLAQDATLALSTGVIHSSEAMARLAKDGATLGLVFQGDAQGGIATLTRTLEQVGATRPLKTLGLDAQAVKEEFETLSKSMSREDAWGIAVMDEADRKAGKLGDALDSTGTHLERLKTGFKDWAQGVAENVATSIDYLVRFGEVISDVSSRGYKPGAGGHDSRWNGDGSAGSQGATGDSMFAGRFPKAQTMQNTPNVIPPSGGMQDPSVAGWLGGSIISAPSYLFGNEDSINAQYSAEVQRRRIQAKLGPAYAGAYSGAQGAYGAGEVEATDAYAASQKQEFLNSLIAKGRDIYNSYTDPLKNMISLIGEASQAQLKADEKNAASMAIIRGEVGGQGGQLAQDASAERQRLVKGHASQKDLDAFDKQSQLAMDSYALATGQATRESLAFRDIQANISKSVAAGTMSIGEEANAMALLARNAAAGKTSLVDLEKVQDQIAAKQAANITDKYGHRAGSKSVAAVGLREAAEGGDYGVTTTGGSERSLASGFSDVAQGADAASVRVSAFKDSITAAGASGTKAISETTATVSALGKALDIATKPRTISINVSVNDPSGLAGRTGGK